jgi:hypothetical protein
LAWLQPTTSENSILPSNSVNKGKKTDCSWAVSANPPDIIGTIWERGHELPARYAIDAGGVLRHTKTSCQLRWFDLLRSRGDLRSGDYRTSREISGASGSAFQERFAGGYAGRIPDDAPAVISVPGGKFLGINPPGFDW